MADLDLQCSITTSPSGVVVTLVSSSMLHQDQASAIAANVLASKLGCECTVRLLYFTVASSGTRCALQRHVPAARPAPQGVVSVSMWPDRG